MRKLVSLILPLLIIAVGIFLISVAAFSTGYKAEKVFYHAWIKYNTLSADPAEAKLEDFQKTKELMREITRKYPRAREAAQSQYLLGQIALMEGNQVGAREEFRLVVDNYADRRHLAAEANFLIAKTYEGTDLELAMEEYKKIPFQYPGTLKAFQTPIHIAQLYQENDQPKKADEAYEDAIKGYRAFAQKMKLPEVDQISRYYIAIAENSRGSRDLAIKEIEALISEYPNAMNLLQWKFTLAGFYYEEVRYDDSRRLYQEIIDVVPDTLMGKLAEKRMRALTGK